MFCYANKKFIYIYFVSFWWFKGEKKNKTLKYFLHFVVLQTADFLVKWWEQQHHWVRWKRFPSPIEQGWAPLYLYSRPMQVKFSTAALKSYNFKYITCLMHVLLLFACLLQWSKALACQNWLHFCTSIFKPYSSRLLLLQWGCFG